MIILLWLTLYFCVTVDSQSNANLQLFIETTKPTSYIAAHKMENTQLNLKT